MLSKEQKEKLRNIHMYEYSCKEKNGKPIRSDSDEKFVVLSPYQIVDNMIQLILDNGFSKVERVSPAKSNCIIRVFQKLNFKYDSDSVLNLYGADCFVKDGVEWINWNTAQLSYDEHLIRHFICQDTTAILHMEFMDVYVKVS